MVILIGGVSCSGKTVMAQKLLEKYHITYLSIDHIKMGIVRGTDNCEFSTDDSDDFITVKIWPIVKGIIMTNIENAQNIIIEGCYIPPDKINDFDSYYLDKIISLFIGFSEKYIIENFESGILSHASDLEARGEEDRPIKWFIESHKALKIICHQNNQKYFEIQKNYEKEIQAAYEWIDKMIKSFT